MKNIDVVISAVVLWADGDDYGDDNNDDVDDDDDDDDDDEVMTASLWIRGRCKQLQLIWWT